MRGFNSMYEDNEQEYRDKMGIYIKKMRERIGINTAKELAVKLHVSTAIVSNWECGIKLPSYLYSIILSNLFNVSIDDFYDLKDIYELYDSKYNNRIKDNKSVFNNLKFNKQKELISEYINIRNQLKNLITKLCNGEEINIEKFLKLSSIINVYLGNEDILFSYNKSFYVNIIEKIDMGFDRYNVFDNIFSKSNRIIEKLSQGKDANYIYEMKYNYDNFENDFYIESDTVNTTKEINDYFISINGLEKDNGYYVIDRNGNRAFVRRISFAFNESANSQALDEFINKIKILKKECKFDNVFSDLFLMDVSENNNQLNEYVDAILFNEKFNCFLDDYVKSLTSFEKYRLFKKYYEECENKRQNLKVNVLYTFLTNGTKIISNFDFFRIDYDINATYKITTEVLKYLYNHKEEIPIDCIPYIT